MEMTLLEDVAMGLFHIGAIKFGAFRLKLHEKNPNAPLSPIYVDLRLVRSHPNLMDAVVAVFQQTAKKLKFDILADVPTAATPIVAVLSHTTRFPMITPREGKTHGSEAKIDGAFKKAQVALLVDDLITKADSKLAAIAVLESNGLIVKDVVVLVDREQGGREQLERVGYNLHAAYTLSSMLGYYWGNGAIDQNKYDEVISYLASN